MIYHELKRCPICGEWRADYEFEEIFTGRMQRVCYNCIREGHKEIMASTVKRNYKKTKKEILK